MARYPYPDISELPRAEVIKALERIVFTSAKDWRRAVWMDRHTRDMIVASLRAAVEPRPAKLTPQSEQDGVSR